MKRKFIVGFLSLFLFLGLSVPALAQENSKKQEQWLFVIMAKQGEITQQNGTYTLTLSETYPHALAFTDRPNRKTKMVKADAFLQNWNKFFGEDQPNVAVVHADLVDEQAGDIKPIALELMNPKKLGQNQWQFQLKTLTGDSPIKLGKFNSVSIFVDRVALLEEAVRRPGRMIEREEPEAAEAPVEVLYKKGFERK